VKVHVVRAGLAFVVAVMGAALFSPAASAFPFPNAGPVVAFGTEVPLSAAPGGNDTVIGYTVDDFKLSTDEVEAFRVGHLWEATLTIKAIRGTVTPVLPFFNARATTGRQYRLLFQAYAADAIRPDPIPQGATSTGKIYFDCNGKSPAMVVYNDGAQDLLTWQ
jgi:hypothetical protein